MKEGDDAGESMKNGDASNNKQMTVESTLYHIMHDAKIDCVKDLADAFPINEKHETINWNRPQTQQPFAAKFCV